MAALLAIKLIVNLFKLKERGCSCFVEKQANNTILVLGKMNGVKIEFDFTELSLVFYFLL